MSILRRLFPRWKEMWRGPITINYAVAPRGPKIATAICERNADGKFRWFIDEGGHRYPISAESIGSGIEKYVTDRNSSDERQS